VKKAYLIGLAIFPFILLLLAHYFLPQNSLVSFVPRIFQRDTGKVGST